MLRINWTRFGLEDCRIKLHPENLPIGKSSFFPENGTTYCVPLTYLNYFLDLNCLNYFLVLKINFCTKFSKNSLLWGDGRGYSLNEGKFFELIRHDKNCFFFVTVMQYLNRFKPGYLFPDVKHEKYFGVSIFFTVY